MMFVAFILGVAGAALIGWSFRLHLAERKTSSRVRDLDGVPWTRLEMHGPGRVVEARTLRLELPESLREPIPVRGFPESLVPQTMLVRTVMLEWDLPVGKKEARFRTHHLVDNHGREMTPLYARGKRDFNGERTEFDGWFTEARGARMCEEIERRRVPSAETVAKFQPVGSGLVLTTTFAKHARRPAGVVHSLCRASAPLEPIRTLSPREATMLKLNAAVRAA